MKTWDLKREQKKENRENQRERGGPKGCREQMRQEHVRYLYEFAVVVATVI